MVPGSPGLVEAPPYPRYPLREFTPCAPGRSTPYCQEANPIRHRRYPPHPKITLPVASQVFRGALIIARFVMVFASDRMAVAEAVTGPFVQVRPGQLACNAG